MVQVPAAPSTSRLAQAESLCGGVRGAMGGRT